MESPCLRNTAIESSSGLELTRRQMLRRGFFGLCGAGLLAQVGCAGKQTAQVIKPGEKEMVGSHTAGAETFGPLVDASVSRLLARHSQGVQPAGFTNGAPQGQSMRICFAAVENRSGEQLGDFIEQLFEIIDAKIMHSGVYQTISRRFVDAGLRQCGLRTDDLMVPQNMRAFTQAMEQMGQPFDYMLYAVLTSGTTRDNKDYQRNYLLTLEMVNLHTGQADKELAEIDKRYNVSLKAKLQHMGQ